MTVEDIPELDRFTHAEAWTLGSRLARRCQAASLPVTISIVIGEQQVFHAALHGTSADNDAWASRKIGTVRHFDLSSAAVHERYAQPDTDFHRVFGLPESRYAAAGGAVPIRVRGTLVGVLAVSGLASAEDHQLAVDALAELRADGAGA